MEESNEFGKPSISPTAFLALLGLAFAAIVGVLIWEIVSRHQEIEALDAVPFSQVTATVTSKDSDLRLSIKSNALPKGGDVVTVDRFAYGAVSKGDSVCVKYKNIPEDSQFATEFVDIGSCQK
jgi:hypothetical protein